MVQSETLMTSLQCVVHGFTDVPQPHPQPTIAADADASSALPIEEAGCPHVVCASSPSMSDNIQGFYVDGRDFPGIFIWVVQGTQNLSL